MLFLPTRPVHARRTAALSASAAFVSLSARQAERTAALLEIPFTGDSLLLQPPHWLIVLAACHGRHAAHEDATPATYPSSLPLLPVVFGLENAASSLLHSWLIAPEFFPSEAPWVGCSPLRKKPESTTTARSENCPAFCLFRQRLRHDGSRTMASLHRSLGRHTRRLLLALVLVQCEQFLDGGGILRLLVSLPERNEQRKAQRIACFSADFACV